MEQTTFFTDDHASQPLASRLRPQSLEEFAGQTHLIGPGKVLRRLIEGDMVSSMIFWGPPGVGKTTLARIIANRTKSAFIDFSAVTSGIKEIRTVMQQAEDNRRFGERTIVFVDEIHRFNKAQQDAFLPFVEKGSIILIGATTENPSFEVNSALLSRCKVFVLKALETKDVFGITFEQGHNNFEINEALLANVVTNNKNIPESAKRDLIIALITLKYTQSNSVCYAVDGQAIGVGAGQQSRIHCTRLAGNKADIWHLRQHQKVLNLPFLPTVGRPDRDNTIDIYISDDYEDVLAEGTWQTLFSEKPEPLTREEKKAYLATIKGVALGSDAFFPFGDNIERAAKSGVSYIAEPGGSIRDDNVIATCNKHGMTMAFTGMRLFHH